MPQRHSIVREISDEETVYRRVLKWNYRIVYSVDEEKIQVNVIDISHGKRDPQRLKDRLSR